ncbi:PaaI family thioesterase [Noviherbaspirillum sp. Root189]|uniref:PaaI family thioesterase n=1 Tax=Noviherbaspirillum sp. Root189 TaxID=1736487 RepID=UPI00070B5B91|nr:PaaI family thioesterase [Noviherbaspirillum sp. Root189]KRB73564.1 aromatic catabolism protein [Noviherbaspirillum sp. Root189]
MQATHQPSNAAYAETLTRSVLAMPMARALGLQFSSVAPGSVEIEIPYHEQFSFRPGQLQATAIFAAADFAAIAAAGTLLPPGWINASIDCTLKIVGPANGEKLVARGRVINAGKLITVSSAEVFSVRNGEESLCATALATARNIELKQ